MSKIIKLKQSDLVKIVENVLIENNESTEEEVNLDENIGGEDSDVQIGKDKEGRFYVVNVKTGEILGIK